MTLRLAGIFSDAVSNNILFVAIGLVVFLVFLIGSRLIAQAIGDQLNKRHLPTGMIVLGRRVVTVLLLVIVITNIPLRGLWSVIVIVLIISITIIFALLEWWETILYYLSYLGVNLPQLINLYFKRRFTPSRLPQSFSR